LSVEDLDRAETVMIKTVQRESFRDEIELLQKPESIFDKENRESVRQKKNLLKGSNLYRLDPFVDEQGVVRVGGRLRRSDMYYPEKHPVLLPKGYCLSKLIIRHYHKRIHHQGRLITSGAVRAAGYWIIGGHAMVSKLTSSCITCKRLRLASLTQHMSYLPIDRTETPPPFTYVGCDVFGPWTIVTRKTRGGSADSKRWGLVFTCLNCRAIHVEVLESLDASAFIRALRQFIAIRVPVRKIRCDRGTNFIGGKTELTDALKEMDEGDKTYLTEQGCEWLFNPPHSSHFGGVWERQIGTICRVLDAMLLELGKHQLTHELLITLLAEVSAIVNARPIAATIPTDTDESQPLSPTLLITMKTCPVPPAQGKFVSQDLYARRRWRRSQYLADQFWLRWRREYLQNLQLRPKWNKRERNLAIGDLVLIKDKESHRNNWPTGKVTEPIVSEDGRMFVKLTFWWAVEETRRYIFVPSANSY
jgi:hypothetical protein